MCSRLRRTRRSTTTLTPPPRDLAKAKALLRQAGVTPPLTLELITPNQPDSLQAAEVIQSMAADAGFNIRIVAMEITAAGQVQQRGDYQVYLNGWSGRVDADGNTFQFLHTGQGNNFTGYSNPSVDGLLEQGRAMTDTGKRRVVYQQVWEALRLDLPVTYLYSPRNIVAMTAKLNGFRPVPDGMIRIWGMEMMR